MLKKLSLQNYRCFEKSEIDFRKTAVIVGNNNAGKSSLVEALRLVGMASSKFKTATYVPIPLELGFPRVTKGIRLNAEELKIDLRTVVYQYREDVYAEIKAFFTSDICVIVRLNNSYAFAVVEKDGNAIFSRTQAKNCDDLELFVMPQLSLIREEEDRLNDDTVRKDLNTRLSSRHFRNELRLFHEHFETFRSMAQSTWPGLRVGELVHEYGEPLSLFVTDDDYATEIGLMGSGLQMWLQIIWFLSRCPETATVVLDEPDVYMHPDLQRKVLRIVQSRFNQIIIATHSVEIISGVEPHDIVTVDKKSRRMRYANSYRAVNEIISNLGSVQNISLVRLGTAKKCVFVEGKDIHTLAAFQRIIHPNALFTVDQLPSLSLGGWTRFNEALGAARLFYEETNGDIQTYCILDRDYHSNEEIEKMYLRAKDNHLQLHVWERKELENYLLSPKALAKVAGVDPESKEYAEFYTGLFEKLDDLREDTLGKILDQLQLSDKTKAPSYFLPQANERLNASWYTLGGRLSIAGGKEILSLANQWMLENYQKTVSRTKLLSALTAEDLPDEMKQVISQLVES